MTYDDDFIQLNTLFFGTIRVTLKDAGLTWPPPELVIMPNDLADCQLDGKELILREPNKDDDMGLVFERKRMSQLTDEQRGATNHVIRGAEYRYLSRQEKNIPVH